VKVTVQHLNDEMHQWLLDQPRAVLTSHMRCLCDWCGHDWHSAKCTALCRCDTARQRLDDTWRPGVTCEQADQIRLVCWDTGCDGWAARYAVGVGVAGIRDPARIRRLLYGKGAE
jgi:hypothetical protein